MALSRAFLKGMGLADEQVSAIIEAHTESTDGLKAQRDAYKSDAERLVEVQRELDTMKASNSEDWEKKYNEEHSAFESYKTEKEAALAEANSAFEAYKTEQENARIESTKRNAYVALLKECGISDKRIDTVMKVTDLNSVELNKDGSIRNAEKMTENIKNEWSDFVQVTQTNGADVETPPNSSSGATMTVAEIMAITDRDARRQAIAENAELFS